MSSEPSTSELVTLGAPIKLRDGSRIRIRQGHRSDRELLLRGFQQLSAESRYRRFLTTFSELSGAMVRYLTEIDHHDHEAMIALDERTGDGIGVARYVRDPKRPDTAEVAVTVVDEWQGRGVGTLLLEVICGRAREEGVKTFTALMLATNQDMMDVFRATGSRPDRRPGDRHRRDRDADPDHRGAAPPSRSWCRCRPAARSSCRSTVVICPTKRACGTIRTLANADLKRVPAEDQIRAAHSPGDPQRTLWPGRNG